MFIAFFLLALVLAISTFASRAIAMGLYHQLVRSGNRHAKAYGIATFILSFVVIFATIVFLFFLAFPFQR